MAQIHTRSSFDIRFVEKSNIHFTIRSEIVIAASFLFVTEWFFQPGQPLVQLNPVNQNKAIHTTLVNRCEQRTWIETITKLDEEDIRVRRQFELVEAHKTKMITYTTYIFHTSVANDEILQAEKKEFITEIIHQRTKEIELSYDLIVHS